MLEKNKIDELSVFNALCCLGVLLIHTLSYAVGRVSSPSLPAALIIAPGRLLLFVVPAFLFSSAVKMSLAFCDGKSTSSGYPKYILSRLRKIFVPYLIWNIIYYAVLITINYTSFSILEFVKSVFLGTLSAQFYYIIVAFQFYLLMPLWKFTVNKVSPYILLPISLLVTLLSTEINNLLGGFNIFFAYSDRIFTSYLFFWIAGLYVGQNADRFRNDFINKKAIIPISVFGAAVYLLMQGYSCCSGIYPFDLYIYAIISYIPCILLTYGISLKISRSETAVGLKLNRFLHWVCKRSYSVYLSHCLFLILAKGMCARSGIERIIPVTLICAFSAFIVPFVFSQFIEFFGKALKNKGRSEMAPPR